MPNAHPGANKVSIQELGSLGEFISAIAVLSTLIYLAIQTRQTRIAAEQTANFAQLSAMTEAASLYSNWRTALYQEPSTVAVLAKANSAETLEPAEIIQFGVICDELFVAAAVSHLKTQSSASSHGGADTNYVKYLMDANPGIGSEWPRMRHILSDISPGFVQIIDDHLNSGEGD